MPLHQLDTYIQLYCTSESLAHSRRLLLFPARTHTCRAMRQERVVCVCVTGVLNADQGEQREQHVCDSSSVVEILILSCTRTEQSDVHPEQGTVAFHSKLTVFSLPIPGPMG